MLKKKRAFYHWQWCDWSMAIVPNWRLWHSNWSIHIRGWWISLFVGFLIHSDPIFPEVRENYQYTQGYIIDIHSLRRCTLWRNIKSFRNNGKIRQNGGWTAFLGSWVKQGTPWKKIMFLLHQPKGQTIFLSNRQDHASIRNHHWSENIISQQMTLYMYIYIYVFKYVYIYS